jgi:hypothetical protein
MTAAIEKIVPTIASPNIGPTASIPLGLGTSFELCTLNFELAPSPSPSALICAHLRLTPLMFAVSLELLLNFDF